MVKELYVNEKLFISFYKEKLKVILVGEQYKAFGLKELKSDPYNFIKRYPYIMESLKAGNVIESSRSNSIVKTKLGQVKGETPFPKEKQLKHFREAEGYSFEESIENLEYSLYKPVKKKKKTSNN